jgi:hypothetical protein
MKKEFGEIKQKNKTQGMSEDEFRYLLSYAAQDALWRLKERPTQGFVYFIALTGVQYSKQRVTYIVELQSGDSKEYTKLFDGVLNGMENMKTKPDVIFLISNADRLGDKNKRQEAIAIVGLSIDNMRGIMTFDIERTKDRILPAKKLNSNIVIAKDIQVGLLKQFFKMYVEREVIWKNLKSKHIKHTQ